LKCYDKIAEAFIDELEKTNKITFPQYDLIHAHFAYPSGFIAKYFSEKYGIPYFVTLHGSDIHSIPYRNEKMKPIIVDVLEGAEKCIFISEAVGYRNENAIIIPNGFDPEIFCYIDKSEAKKKLGIDKTKCIGFVGNLIELKNVMLLPNIFEKVKRQYDDVNFVIVGDGELRYKLQKLCEQKLLDVSFTGFLSQEKVADYMRAMDVMVLPSKKEGFGAVLVEAQACGTYCIGSDRGGIPEAIGNKDAIFSLEDDFIENASKHILNILENGFFQGKILKRVEAYTWEHITDKVIKLYKQKRIMNSYNSLFLETDSFLKEN
jgi:glycosyltransferase involved in cell wall biosynthesis